jgi:hypothetical protein
LSATVRSSRDTFERLSSSSLRSAPRSLAAVLAVAKLDELRRDLLALVLDLGFELRDGLDGRGHRVDDIRRHRLARQSVD